MTAVCLTAPTVQWNRPIYRYLFVVDITQSMNAQDYPVAGLPADRLGFAKASIRETLHALPCGSEVGLGLFTTQNTQILFEPLEICRHFPAIDDVLNHIDWRMAWSAHSFIAQGVYSALHEITQRDPSLRLAFFTDGNQFPPQADLPFFHGKPGEVGGLLVGVGGTVPVPVPRLDQDNKPLGFWEYVDLRDYLPSQEVEAKGGGNLYLSKLDETELLRLADVTGLRYHRLTTPSDLVAALQTPELAQQRLVPTDVRWLPALMALVLLLAGYFPRPSTRGF